jgi:hypothetical protein
MTYYGADQQTAKVQQLAEKKAQLQAALPVVDDARAAAIEARLDRIDAALQKEIAHAKAIGNVAAIKAAMGIDGIGGLEFQAQAPAGVGRLVRLPFYPIAALTGNYEAVGTTVPVVEASGTAFGTAQNASIVLRTPQISWATLRIVGFETEQQCQTNLVTATGAGIAPASTPNAKLVVSDLKIGGGANLFTHEDFADGQIYDADQPEFCGLRDYPILKSPNVAEVTVASLNIGVTAVGDIAHQFSCALLCEVLQDDNYGSHIPGPYARSGAMVRKGGSFI